MNPVVQSVAAGNGKGKLTDLEKLQVELSRTNLRLAKAEKALAEVTQMLLTYQRLHHGSQSAMRSWADKVSAGIDKTP